MYHVQVETVALTTGRGAKPWLTRWACLSGQPNALGMPTLYWTLPITVSMKIVAPYTSACWLLVTIFLRWHDMVHTTECSAD